MLSPDAMLKISVVLVLLNLMGMIIVLWLAR
jgi:hypothetical protein